MVPRSDERGRLARKTYGTLGKVLQWCRALMSAEGVIVASLPLRPMAMLQWCRALMSAEGCVPGSRNGLFIPLQWCRALMSAEGPPLAAGSQPRGIASMVPRSDERGRERAELGAVGKASMVPRSDERGRLTEELLPETSLHASMVPRSDERGRTSGSSSGSGDDRLQWCRALMSAEGVKVSSTVPDAVARLQWCRALMSAEGQVGLRNRTRPTGFNGAAL